MMEKISKAIVLWQVAINVIEVASREIVDEVFLVLDDQRKNEIIEYAEQFAQMGVIVHVNIDLLDHLGAGYQREVTQIGNHYALSVAPRFFDFNKLVMKRINRRCRSDSRTDDHSSCDAFYRTSCKARVSWTTHI